MSDIQHTDISGSFMQQVVLVEARREPSCVRVFEKHIDVVRNLLFCQFAQMRMRCKNQQERFAKNRFAKSGY
jgi:hypothetical protein